MMTRCSVCHVLLYLGLEKTKSKQNKTKTKGLWLKKKKTTGEMEVKPETLTSQLWLPRCLFVFFFQSIVVIRCIYLFIYL